jgi:hypothetical protein
MALEGTVKTPFGEMKKKTAAIAGIGGIAIIGIIYYKNKQTQAANAAATAAAANSAANQTGTNNTQIDPATGFPYGSAEDEQALAAQQGIQYTPWGGYGGGGGGGGGGGNPGPPFTSNAAWASYCEQSMGSTGADAIAAALGHYLVGVPLATGENTIVDQAIAIGGYPPVAGPNGYPPAFKTGGGGGGGNVNVPNVVGQETDAAVRAIQAVGLIATHPALQPGKGSTVTAESPAAGTSVATGSTVALTIKEK